MNKDYDMLKMTFELSNFQIRKYEVMFDCLDSGKDGYLDFADLVPHVNYIKNNKEWAEDGEEFLKMMNAKASFWMVVCYIEDAILLNKITKPQWVHFWAEMADAVNKGKTYHFGRQVFKVTKNKAPGWTTVIMHSLFEIMDADFSGEITRKEYRLYLESIHINLSKDEFDKAWSIITHGKPETNIRIDDMEELLVQWLINTDENKKVPGDYFPSGGYGIQ